jgi:hypothetical protein
VAAVGHALYNATLGVSRRVPATLAASCPQQWMVCVWGKPLWMRCCCLGALPVVLVQRLHHLPSSDQAAAARSRIA